MYCKANVNTKVLCTFPRTIDVRGFKWMDLAWSESVFSVRQNKSLLSEIKTFVGLLNAQIYYKVNETITKHHLTLKKKCIILWQQSSIVYMGSVTEKGLSPISHRNTGWSSYPRTHQTEMSVTSRLRQASPCWHKRQRRC